jgi:hypothetical protein
MSSGSFRARLQPLRSAGAGLLGRKQRPLMMECESTVAVNAFTLSAVTEVWSSCPRPGRAQKGLHQHTPIGPLLAPDNPSAFACAAPWRQQRSREPLRQQRGPQRAQTFDSNGPGVRIRASAAPCIRDSSLDRPWRVGDDGRWPNRRREFLPERRALFPHQQHQPREQSAGDAATPEHASRHRDGLIRCLA